MRGRLDFELSVSNETSFANISSGVSRWPCFTMKSSMNDAWGGRDVERESGNSGREDFAPFRLHEIAAFHGAVRGREGASAGVGEAFARAEDRLFSDHAGAAPLLDEAVPVDDLPVPRAQLHPLLPCIDDFDGVGKEVAAVIG